MNTLYYLNKGVGVLFAMLLVVLGGYQLAKWRSDMINAANSRLKERMAEISENSQFQFSATTPFNSSIPPDYWTNFKGSTVLPIQSLYSGQTFYSEDEAE